MIGPSNLSLVERISDERPRLLIGPLNTWTGTLHLIGWSGSVLAGFHWLTVPVCDWFERSEVGADWSTTHPGNSTFIYFVLLFFF